MKTRFFAYKDGQFVLSKETIKITEGEDVDQAWKDAGYRRFIGYPDQTDLPILEIWRLKEETKALPLFLANLEIDGYGHEVQIDTLPDLMAFCREVQAYVSITAEVRCG